MLNALKMVFCPCQLCVFEDSAFVQKKSNFSLLQAAALESCVVKILALKSYFCSFSALLVPTQGHSE